MSKQIKVDQMSQEIVLFSKNIFQMSQKKVQMSKKNNSNQQKKYFK